MKILKYSLLIMSLFTSLPLHAEPTQEVDPHGQMIRQVVSAFMQNNAVPGVAIETFVDGKPYAYYFGVANKAKHTPVTKETIFEIGSISKIMTSLLLAQEIDFARASLNDSVKKYIHNLGDDFKNITLKALATHTSGLPIDVPYSVKSRRDLDKYLAKWSPQTRPGSVWIYSNLGIGVLGYILETLNEHTYEELYLNRILTPLGMHPVMLNAKDIQQHLAQGYDSRGKPVKPSSLGLFPAAYGVKASAEDMQNFLSAAIGLPGTTERIFYPMRLTQTAFVALPNRLQGLGWQIHRLNSHTLYSLLRANDVTQLGPLEVIDILNKPTFDGDALIDKTGATSGFRAYIAVIPNKKSGLVILTNKYIPDSEVVKMGRELLFKMTKLAD